MYVPQSITDVPLCKLPFSFAAFCIVKFSIKISAGVVYTKSIIFVPFFFITIKYLKNMSAKI
jgi:hypothetical protein